MRTMLRLPQLTQRYGKGRSAVYADMKAGLLPPVVKLGARAAALPADELDAVLAARIAGKTDDEIRALVRRLVTARTAVAAAPQ